MISGSVCDSLPVHNSDSNEPNDQTKTYMLRSRVGRPSYRTWLKGQELQELVHKRSKNNKSPKRNAQTKSSLSTDILNQMLKQNSEKKIGKSCVSSTLQMNISNTCLDQNDGKIWCICKKPWDLRFMLACDSCDEWYHGDCVGVSEQDASNRNMGFVCYKCKTANIFTSTEHSSLIISENNFQTSQNLLETTKSQTHKYKAGKRMIVLLDPNDAENKRQPEYLQVLHMDPSKLNCINTIAKQPSIKGKDLKKHLNLDMIKKTVTNSETLQNCLNHTNPHLIITESDSLDTKFKTKKNIVSSLLSSSIKMPIDDSVSILDDNTNCNQPSTIISNRDVKIISDNDKNLNYLKTSCCETKNKTIISEDIRVLTDLNTLRKKTRDDSIVLADNGHSNCLNKSFKKNNDITINTDDKGTSNDSNTSCKETIDHTLITVDSGDSIGLNTLCKDTYDDTLNTGDKEALNGLNTSSKDIYDDTIITYDDSNNLNSSHKESHDDTFVTADVNDLNKSRIKNNMYKKQAMFSKFENKVNSMNLSFGTSACHNQSSTSFHRGSSHIEKRRYNNNTRFDNYARFIRSRHRAQRSRPFFSKSFVNINDQFQTIDTIFNPTEVIPTPNQEYSNSKNELFDHTQMSNIFSSDSRGIFRNDETSNKSNWVWKGQLNCKEVPTFTCTAFVLLGNFNVFREAFPSKIQPTGRLSRKAAWDYIEKIVQCKQRPFTLVYFLPATYQEKLTYASFFRQLYLDKRSILMKLDKSIIKDIYVVPLSSSESLPEFIIQCGVKHLSAGHPDLLIAAIISNIVSKSSTFPYVTVSSTPSRDPRLKKSSNNNSSLSDYNDRQINKTYSLNVDKHIRKIISELSTILVESPNPIVFSELVVNCLKSLEKNESNLQPVHTIKQCEKKLDCGRIRTTIDSTPCDSIILRSGENICNDDDVIVLDSESEEGSKHLSSNQCCSGNSTKSEGNDNRIDLLMAQNVDEDNGTGIEYIDNYDVVSMDLEDDSTSTSTSWGSLTLQATDTFDVDLRISRKPNENIDDPRNKPK